MRSFSSSLILGIEHPGIIDKQNRIVVDHKGAWEAYADQGNIIVYCTLGTLKLEDIGG